MPTPKTINHVLEEIKQRAYYGVMLWYGEGIGCDDSDVKPHERSVRMLAFPVGCLGEVKVFWSGKLEQFLDFDFSTTPVQISNPPSKLESEKLQTEAWAMWGTEDGIEGLKAHWAERQGVTLV